MTLRQRMKSVINGTGDQRAIRRAVLTLALPIVGSDLLQRGVNVVDALLVGRLGAAELAAVGLSQLLLMFVMALVYGLGVGATVMVAFHTGATDERRRAWAARTVLVVGGAATLILGSGGIVWSRAAVAFMGADGRLLDLTLTYLHVTWYLFGAYVFLHLMSAIFPGVGDTRTPLKAMVWVNGRKAREEFGEMVFTEFGVSGPIVLTMSRFVVDELRQQHQVILAVDLKPALDATKLDNRLMRDLAEHGKTRMDSLFRKWLPAAMIPVFLGMTGVPGGKAGHQLTARERRKILLLLKDFRLVVTGYRPFQEAIITAGGVVTSEIEATTMESKLIRHLYFAGEMIDLDADTGGYNLQIAFSTGWLAAEACMKPRV